MDRLFNYAYRLSDRINVFDDLPMRYTAHCNMLIMTTIWVIINRDGWNFRRFRPYQNVVMKSINHKYNVYVNDWFGGINYGMV